MSSLRWNIGNLLQSTAWCGNNCIETLLVNVLDSFYTHLMLLKVTSNNTGVLWNAPNCSQITDCEEGEASCSKSSTFLCHMQDRFLFKTQIWIHFEMSKKPCGLLQREKIKGHLSTAAVHGYTECTLVLHSVQHTKQNFVINGNYILSQSKYSVFAIWMCFSI